MVADDCSDRIVLSWVIVSSMLEAVVEDLLPVSVVVFYSRRLVELSRLCPSYLSKMDLD